MLLHFEVTKTNGFYRLMTFWVIPLYQCSEHSRMTRKVISPWTNITEEISNHNYNSYMQIHQQTSSICKVIFSRSEPELVPANIWRVLTNLSEVNSCTSTYAGAFQSRLISRVTTGQKIPRGKIPLSFICICMHTHTPYDELITRPRSPTDWSETESFMGAAKALIGL
jgi:hypothetical protein